MTETKYMTVGEFIDLGFLQEVNRLVLHPAGLALEIEIEPKATGGLEFTGKVWDYRDDPEGVAFAEGVIDGDKILRVVKEQLRHSDARAALFGDDGFDPGESVCVVQLP